MSDCTRTLTEAEGAAIDKIVAELPAGAVLCLGDGVYPATLWVERSLTIRGLGDKVVLDAAGRGTTVNVVREGADLTLERVTLRRGEGGALGHGGNLHVDKPNHIMLRDVVLEDGRSDSNGGGAILSNANQLTLERCTLRRNHGARGSAMQILAGSTVVLKDCLIVDNDRGRPGAEVPAILLDHGSNLTIERSTIFGNGGEAVKVTGDRDPYVVTIGDSILGDPPLSGPPARDTVTKVIVRGCALSRAIAAQQDGGGNLVGEIKLDDKHQPVAGSIAAGKGPRRR